MKRIVITGGNGFIGTAAVTYAKQQGHEVWSFDRADGHDILRDLHMMYGATHVIHLAGMLGTSELFDTPSQAIDANVQGTLRILQWCEANDAAYVGISMPDSSWANVYQATKLCAVRLASAWHRNYGVPVSHVRAYNAFGSGQKHGPHHPAKILPTFSTAAWAGKPIPIWGNGLQSVDLVHADDVGRMLVDACNYGNDVTFDAGTGVALTVRQVAAMVNRYATRPVNSYEFLPMRKGETPETAIVARGDGWEALGWKPELDLEKLRQTVEWYRP